MAIFRLFQRSSSPLTRCNVDGARRVLCTSRSVGYAHQHCARWAQSPRRGVSVKAARNGQNGPSFSKDFNLADYVEARVENVHHSQKHGHVILLKLLDGRGFFLPVYIGDSESNALEKELNHKSSARPMTHDFMKAALETVGFRVTKVCVTELREKTYLARVHLSASGKDAIGREADIDARPSDAINLAVRFNAPVYVSKEVAGMMGSEATHFQEAPESEHEIRRSCRQVKQLYHDPTVVHRLSLQVAIAEERYDDACELRDKLDKMLANDRMLSLMVAMESALDDARYEEAALLRDQLKRLSELKKMRAPQGIAEA